MAGASRPLMQQNIANPRHTNQPNAPKILFDETPEFDSNILAIKFFMVNALRFEEDSF